MQGVVGRKEAKSRGIDFANDTPYSQSMFVYGLRKAFQESKHILVTILLPARCFHSKRLEILDVARTASGVARRLATANPICFEHDHTLVEVFLRWRPFACGQG